MPVIAKGKSLLIQSKTLMLLVSRIAKLGIKTLFSI